MGPLTQFQSKLENQENDIARYEEDLFHSQMEHTATQEELKSSIDNTQRLEAIILGLENQVKDLTDRLVEQVNLFSHFSVKVC